MSDPLAPIVELWQRWGHLYVSAWWQRALNDWPRGGLPSHSGPVGGGRKTSSEYPMPSFDDPLDVLFDKWKVATNRAHLNTDAYKLEDRIARRWLEDATDPLSVEVGHVHAQKAARASRTACDALRVSCGIMMSAQPLDASEARKLAEEAVSPKARTCANVFCSAVVERLLGDRCRNCYNYLKETGLERGPDLIAREVEKQTA